MSLLEGCGRIAPQKQSRMERVRPWLWCRPLGRCLSNFGRSTPQPVLALTACLSQLLSAHPAGSWCLLLSNDVFQRMQQSCEGGCRAEKSNRPTSKYHLKSNNNMF